MPSLFCAKFRLTSVVANFTMWKDWQKDGHVLTFFRSSKKYLPIGGASQQLHPGRPAVTNVVVPISGHIHLLANFSHLLSGAWSGWSVVRLQLCNSSLRLGPGSCTTLATISVFQMATGQWKSKNGEQRHPFPMGSIVSASNPLLAKHLGYPAS